MEKPLTSQWVIQTLTKYTIGYTGYTMYNGRYEILNLFFLCGAGASRYHCERAWSSGGWPVDAQSGVCGGSWRARGKGKPLLSDQWESRANDSHARGEGPRAGSAAGAAHHGPCWTGESLKWQLESVWSLSEIFPQCRLCIESLLQFSLPYEFQGFFVSRICYQWQCVCM